MQNTLYITNNTSKPMHAVIADDFTGNSLLTYELHPGTNEITVQSLESGTYLISLEDERHETFYQQKLVKD